MSEEEYFKRITMSLLDIMQCLKYLERILVCDDETIRRALEEASVISYTRPFSGYNKNYHKITDLKKNLKKNLIVMN